MRETPDAQPVQTLFERQFDLLKMELDLIDKAIRQHDEITMSIKNWAIVTWTASMGGALSRAEFRAHVWAVGAVPLLFWFVDTLFRRIQTTFIDRSEQIARYINSTEFRQEALSNGPISLPLLQMRHHPDSRRAWFRQYFNLLRYYSIAGLYVGLAAISVLVWLAVR